MTDRTLSDEEIRTLDRDLRILLATNGTLTRILNVVANEEIVVQIVNQQIRRTAAKVAELGPSVVGRVLQRNILLKGRNSGTVFVAAESLVAIDLLPPEIMVRLTRTDHPIGEVMAASYIETFKEAARVWLGDLPRWLALDGYQHSRRRTVGRRYRILTGGQPVIVITEYFLRAVFHDAPHEETDRRQFSNVITAAR
ncbi:chorismate--pyruvate lyase [Mycobacterium kansasii]|uniref:Chorismate pyruvate-lyase n=1 Tax=Mycobacterium attenuatum TaxID=2341086 RepID=A0A498PVS6_9MYCO|nr:chorismate pyruvate-lyase family protein [Mycobacterium attenuatum]ORB86272.1 chorismate--pyruvate lyase [Mycobacterium kansasii]VBA37027.1 Chorismate pyruvate-lyase [Mycobacterium attenuatum]VBA49869.1 Chorismate pyruvate-lyase [Mycobacterium attenuatum]VBA55447.1 Chorismate pyruvate-lyase [Mycobacterium attenuatum]